MTRTTDLIRHGLSAKLNQLLDGLYVQVNAGTVPLRQVLRAGHTFTEIFNSQNRSIRVMGVRLRSELDHFLQATYSPADIAAFKQAYGTNLSDWLTHRVLAKTAMSDETIPTEADVLRIRSLVRLWVSGEADREAITPRMQALGNALAKFRPMEPVRVYRNERKQGEDGWKEQYDFATAWSTDIYDAKVFGDVDRRLVTAIAQPEDILVSVPMVEGWCQVYDLGIVDAEKQDELVMVPHPSFEAERQEIPDEAALAALKVELREKVVDAWDERTGETPLPPNALAEAAKVLDRLPEEKVVALGEELGVRAPALKEASAHLNNTCPSCDSQRISSNEEAHHGAAPSNRDHSRIASAPAMDAGTGGSPLPSGHPAPARVNGLPSHSGGGGGRDKDLLGMGGSQHSAASSDAVAKVARPIQIPDEFPLLLRDALVAAVRARGTMPPHEPLASVDATGMWRQFMGTGMEIAHPLTNPTGRLTVEAWATHKDSPHGGHYAPGAGILTVYVDLRDPMWSSGVVDILYHELSHVAQAALQGVARFTERTPAHSIDDHDEMKAYGTELCGIYKFALEQSPDLSVEDFLASVPSYPEKLKTVMSQERWNRILKDLWTVKRDYTASRQAAAPSPVLSRALKTVYESDDLYLALDPHGPFDGGCLIAAKAIIRAAGGGELIRLVSDHNGGQTEHYGAKVRGAIYDFLGGFSSPAAWIAALRQAEGWNTDDYRVVSGYDPDSDIPDDPHAEKEVAKLLMGAMAGPAKQASATLPMVTPVFTTRALEALHRYGLMSKRVTQAVSTSAAWAYNYAWGVMNARWPEGEAAIARSSERSVLYARSILKGRFPEAEATIAQDPRQAAIYAIDTIKGRWPEGEAAISGDPTWAQAYARHVIQGRWPEGEAAIASDAKSAYLYVRNTLKARWPKGEHAIAKDAEYAYRYATDVIDGRFLEAEGTIALVGQWAYEYALRALKSKWPLPHKALAERNIGMLEGLAWAQYKKLPEPAEGKTSAASMVLWHGGDLENPNDSDMSNKGGLRWEYGPGLYATTHYDTARKYAKGSRKLYRITLQQGSDANEHILPMDAVQAFVDEHMAARAKRDVLRDSARYTEKGLRAAWFINIIKHYNALPASKSGILRKFLVDQGVDYEIVDNAYGWNERMVVIFNMKKVTNIQRVMPKEKLEEFDLPTTFKESSRRSKFLQPKTSMVVFHGTPHDFEKFKTDRIGIGEGNQVYGWGLYFSDTHAVADYYRDSLSNASDVSAFIWQGKDYKAKSGPESHAISLAFFSGIPMSRRIAKEGLADAKAGKPYALEMGGEAYWSKMLEVANAIKSKREIKIRRGLIYEVDIPDDGRYLLWDSPLAAQPPAVAAALAKTDASLWRPGLKNPAIGGDFYRELKNSFLDKHPTNAEASKAASLYLLSLGIVGIKYLDADSRKAKHGSFNYVVFDDRFVKVVKKASERTTHGPAPRNDTCAPGPTPFRGHPGDGQRHAGVLSLNASRTSRVSKFLQPKTAGPAIDLQPLMREFMTALDPEGKFPLPSIKYVSRSGVAWLGICYNRSVTTDAGIATGVAGEILVQKGIAVDLNHLRSVVAHEVTHHVAVNERIVGLPVDKISDAAATLSDAHGAHWLRVVERINAIYGADFVTQFSDMESKTWEAKEVFLFIVEHPKSEVPFYSWSPSVNQKTVNTLIEQRAAGCGVYITKTTSRFLTQLTAKSPTWTHAATKAELDALTSTIQELQDTGANLFSTYASGVTKTRSTDNKPWTLVMATPKRNATSSWINAWAKTPGLTTGEAVDLGMVQRDGREVRTVKLRGEGDLLAALPKFDLHSILNLPGIASDRVMADDVQAQLRTYWESAATPKASKFLQPKQAQVVFHGSPHDFDQFSLDHFSKGEGASAYGCGLYFTSNEAVADYYKRTLSLGNMTIEGKPFKPRREILEILGAHRENLPAAAEALKVFVKSGEYHNRYGHLTHARKAIKAIKDGTLDLGDNAGHLYAAQIPDDGSYLLWDEPLQNQPPKVKAAIKKIIPTLNRKDYGDFTPDMPVGFNLLYALMKAQGKSGPGFGGRETSMLLRSYGILGVKYLDQESRGAEAGQSYNYVVYDDADVRVVGKQAGGLPAGPRAWISPQGEVLNTYDAPHEDWALGYLQHQEPGEWTGGAADIAQGTLLSQGWARVGSMANLSGPVTYGEARRWTNTTFRAFQKLVTTTPTWQNKTVEVGHYLGPVTPVPLAEFLAANKASDVLRPGKTAGMQDGERSDSRQLGKPLTQDPRIVERKIEYVKLYRAVAAGTDKFRDMDYCTLNKDFAIGHAEHGAAVDEEPYWVLEGVFPVGWIYEAYNPGEYFFHRKDGGSSRGKRIHVAEPEQ